MDELAVTAIVLLVVSLVILAGAAIGAVVMALS